MTSSIVPDALFTDALSGADGTDDPPPTRWRPQSFPDALLAPQLEANSVDDQVAVTVIPVPVPSPEDWARDLDLPTPPPSSPASAARAEAARQAAAARRDAARTLSRADPRSRRGARAGTAQSGPQMAAASTVYAPTPPAPPTYRQPSYQAQAYRQPSYASPTAFPQQVTAARHPPPVQPAGRPAPHASSPSRRPTPAGTQRKKASGLWGALVFLIFLLIASGLGQRILDALSDLVNR